MSSLAECLKGFEAGKDVKAELRALARKYAKTMPKEDAEKRAAAELLEAVMDDIETVRDELIDRGVDVGLKETQTLFQSLSTRLPSAVKAMEDPLNEVLTLDFDVALSDTKTLEKNMQALLATPNMRKPKGKGSKTPAKQAELFIDHVVSNLLFLHDAMDPDMRARAKLWYDGGRKTVETWAERYGISEMQGAALIAVLSPQNPWFANVSQAERIADIVFGMRDFRWDDAMTAEADRIAEGDATMAEAKGKTLEELLDRPDVAARWLRVYDQTHNNRSYRILTPEGGASGFVQTNKGADGTLAWNGFRDIAKAISVLVDGRAENIYYQIGREHKVRNFYNNLFDPKSPLGFVTIDTHAVAAAMLRPLAGGDLEVLQAFGGGGASSSSFTGLNGTYPLYAEAYRRAAEARGLLPREMQSIAWEAVRGLFESTKKSGMKPAAAAIWERYKAGEIEQEQAQQEIFELAGGVTPPSWSLVPYTDEVQRTYTGPAQERIDARGPAGKTDSDGFRVFFEVAPDPNDAALTAEWDALPQNAKQTISQQVAQAMVPKVLTEIGASGAFDTQLGGYLGATNPSLALILDQPELLASAAKLLGYVLSQDGMMVVSDRQTVGTQPVGAVTIDLPDGYGAREVEALYDKLWELEQEGEKLVGGHTTANGHMVILNYSNLDTKALADVIYEHLGGEFTVRDSEIFSAFINKEAYQYGRETDQRRAATGRTPIQGRADNLRNEATRLLREALDARGTQTLYQLAPVRGGGPQILRAGDVGRVRANYGEQAPGGRSVVGIHYSSEPRESLSGDFYGSGIKGAEAKRLDLSDDPRLKKRIHFYVDRGQGIRPEPGVGANIHAVNLNNLYDISEDPLGLKAAAYADKMVDPSVAFNNLESAIIDAGFDGILVPNAQTNNGVAVLLGDKHVNVPVDLVQPPRGGQAAQAAPAVPSVSARVIQEPDGSQRIMYTDNDTARIAGSVVIRDGAVVSTEIRAAFEGKGFEQAFSQDLQLRGVDVESLFPQRLGFDTAGKSGILREKEVVYERAEQGDAGPISPGGGEGALSEERGLRPLPGARLVELRSTEKRSVPATVVSPRHAAAAMSFLSDAPQEQLSALVLDKNGKPLAILSHSLGKINSTQVDNRALLGAIQDVEGAKSFYLVHNHPAETAVLSSADLGLSENIRAINEGSGLSYGGIIAVTPSGYGDEFGDNQIYPPPGKQKKVPVVQRLFVKADRVRGLGPVSSPEDIKSNISIITGGAESGIILLSNNNVPIGFLPLDPAEMSRLRGDRLGEVLKSFHRTNATGIVGILPNEAALSAWRNVAAMANAINARPLDALFRNGAGSLDSARMQGKDVDSYGSKAFLQQQGEPQAAFTFKTKSGRPLIELFRTANQSSFLHETGHLYLEMMRELALAPNAPAPVTALWAQTKAALKIDDGPISREAHEEWARNLEAYFLEGAAPSLGLRKIFAQYAQWLRSIYKQVEQIFRQSGTQFNADLKPIFDRIFASEKDIEEARSFYSSQKPFFAALDPKVMAKEREKYEERRMRARESMEDKRLRQLTEAWVKVSGGKGKIRAEVTEEVKARPVVAVLAALSSGGAGSIKNENLVSALREDPIDPAEYVWVFGTDWAASDSDAVRAAIQEMEDISGRVSAAAAERDSKLEEYEAVIGRIRKLGGIRADTVKESLGKDLAEDIRKKFGTGIVTKDGMPLDEVAMVLQERAGGYGFDGYPETVIDYLSSPYSLTKTQINKDFSDVSSSAKARIKELETLVSNDATRKKAKEDEAAALREVPSGVFKKGGKLPGEVAKKLGFETTSELYSALREYQAQRDTKSFNMKALDASVGEDLRKQLKAIGRYSSLVKKEGTVDPDILAAENGYDSAVAMVEDLISFPGEKAAITAGVEARMEAERQRISRGLADTDLAADEAYHNDDQLAVLVAEFEILSQQAAQKTKRLEASMVRDVAKQLLASEKVNFATQSSRFARLERRAAKLARDAYERGDAKKAAEYKRQEVLNHAMFIESVALKEGVAKTAARIKRGIQKTKGISPEVKTLLQGLGIQYGILPYKKERDPVRAFEMWNQDLVAKGGNIPTIEGWVEEMRKLGISAPLDPFLNNAAAVGYKDITVGQFRALEEGVRILRRVDRGLHTVTWIDGSTITMEDAIERLQAHVAGRGGKAPDPLTYDPNAVTLAARNFFAEHTKTSTIIQALDNWEAGGLFYQLIYRPVMDADSDLSARWATEAPKIKALFEPIRRQLRKKVVVLGKARTRAQLVAVALNTGNAGNRERLKAGLGINEAQLQQFLDPLTVEEMDFVQAVWDYIATFKDEAFAVERRLTGREPAAVDPVPFEFKGKIYAGGYYPVSYDRNLRDQKGEARDAKEALDELFGGTPAGTAMTAHGHLEARASAGTGERLSQELSVISDHVAQVLRDITHREAVVNVAKLLKNKQIMAMITDVVGREKAKQLWPWLVSVSKEGREQIQLTAVEKMLLHFRPAMTFYTQAYKVGTALMQAAGFFQVFEFVKPGHVGQAVWQLYGKGLLSLNMFSDGEIISHPLIKEIREKSPQMNERLLNADRDIRDATKEFSTSESALATYKKAGFKATVAMQFYVADVVAWQGAYLQALTDGMTEKDAINRADFVVEQAMGAGYTRALSKIQRGGSIQRFLTMFYTFGNVLYNLAARRAGITKKQLASGQYGAAALGASSFLVLQWVMPVLLEALVRGDVADDDDDETLAEKLLVNLLTYPAQSVLIARELSGIAKGFKYRFSPALKPFESVGQWISSVARAIEQEDASIAAKPTAQLVGTTTGLIPAQFINSGEVLTDYLTGEDQELSVKELLYGKRRQ